MSRRFRFPISSRPRTSTASLTTAMSRQSETLATIDGRTDRRQGPPLTSGSLVGVHVLRVGQLCDDSCVMTPLQYHAEQSPCPKGPLRSTCSSLPPSGQPRSFRCFQGHLSQNVAEWASRSRQPFSLASSPSRAACTHVSATSCCSCRPTSF